MRQVGSEAVQEGGRYGSKTCGRGGDALCRGRRGRRRPRHLLCRQPGPERRVRRGSRLVRDGRARLAGRRALGKAKLPAFRLYDLCHTFASLLLAASAPITYVSAQLGHVNPSTTLRYYARWIPTKRRRWVDLLDRVSGAVAAAAEAVSGPIWNQIWNQTAAKSQVDWWAVKDSNLGPAD